MPIQELRILPPLAIGRLGAASEPLEAFDLEISPSKPLDYRRIVPQPTPNIDPTTGEIVEVVTPARIRFKEEDGKIRPVAPFLEVFAITSEAPDTLQPLTTSLLAQDGLSVADLSWHVEVGNIKLFRRTQQADDKIIAAVDIAHDNNTRVPLLGACHNFLAGRTLPLGWVQFIKPTAAYPEIRLRFTPAAGNVYGAARVRHTSPTTTEVDPIIDDDALVLYDKDKGPWYNYRENSGPTVANPSETPTNPAQIFAGYDDGNDRVSWGYLDDECDGYVRITLQRKVGAALTAQSHIGAGPPAFAPDTLPIRVVSDELEQILYGTDVDAATVTIDDAMELVRRALETVRLMNTAVMNGNAINGRQNVASTMVRQDTNDFERYYGPIAATSLVDNLALRALHERVFAALSAGGAPWFQDALRRPEEIGDLSDATRRKMPALMRGADGRDLTLTRRQIDLVIKAASQAMFAAPASRAASGASEHAQ
jgi:hypothetical protein